MNKSKLAAYQTLYECIITVCKLTAPFTPFISEEIYQHLNSETKKEKFESIHLSDFPEVKTIDKNLELKMDIAQQVVYITRAMRAKSNLKVRQPLKKIMVVADKSKREALQLMKDVILEEVNIKELIVLEDDSEIVKKSAKPDFKVLGPKFGKKVNAVANLIRNFDKEQITKLEKNESVIMNIDGEEFIITKNDAEIVSAEIKDWVVESDNGIIVALDTELNENLIAEGLAREFVNRVQNMRKDAGFDVTDKINIDYDGNEVLVNAIKIFTHYIASETLADKVHLNKNLNGKEQLKIGEYNCSIKIEKISS